MGRVSLIAINQAAADMATYRDALKVADRNAKMTTTREHAETIAAVMRRTVAFPSGERGERMADVLSKNEVSRMVTADAVVTAAKGWKADTLNQVAAIAYAGNVWLNRDTLLDILAKVTDADAFAVAVKAGESAKRKETAAKGAAKGKAKGAASGKGAPFDDGATVGKSIPHVADRLTELLADARANENGPTPELVKALAALSAEMNAYRAHFTPAKAPAKA